MTTRISLDTDCTLEADEEGDAGRVVGFLALVFAGCLGFAALEGLVEMVRLVAGPQ